MHAQERHGPTGRQQAEVLRTLADPRVDDVTGQGVFRRPATPGAVVERLGHRALPALLAAMQPQPHHLRAAPEEPSDLVDGVLLQGEQDHMRPLRHTAHRLPADLLQLRHHARRDGRDVQMRCRHQPHLLTFRGADRVPHFGSPA